MTLHSRSPRRPSRQPSPERGHALVLARALLCLVAAILLLVLAPERRPASPEARMVRASAVTTCAERYEPTLRAVVETCQ